jgi:ATP-dependent Lon protease
MKLFRTVKPSGDVSQFPLLPLKEMVIFPQTMVPVFVAHRAGIDALEEALRGDSRLFAACQKSAAPEAGAASPWDTWEAGTVVRVLQHLRLPDRSFRVVLQGEYRGVIKSRKQQNKAALVTIEALHSPPGDSLPGNESEAEALLRAVRKSFAQYVELSKKVPPELVAAADKTENAERLANIVCNALAVKPEKKAELIGITDAEKRLQAVLETLELENEIFGIQKTISGKVKSKLEKTHREYILNEQMKEIRKELGKKEGSGDEYADLEKAIAARRPNEEVINKVKKEITRLRKLQPFSPEAGVLRGYLEWVADLPWNEYTADSGDLVQAQRILDEDHFNMRKAKERILEFIAVRQLGSVNARADSAHADNAHADSASPGGGAERTGVKGPILCFVGPPGTGKTSLGKSVARALGRRFVRISLGGVRDEAEIRGHRKTYVGALPGRIIQSMRKAGTMNPVFLLDEIDKLASDFRGDPASALLEVLDPEQNAAFTDHYLEVPYDLSKVLFITTANSLHTIPYALLDRMEVIDIPGYGENEKLAIAQEFLVPKELAENGLAGANIAFKDEAIREIIRHWTMESGVRGLEREIARCVRRIAREAEEKNYGRADKPPVEAYEKTIRAQDLEKLLGRRKIKDDVVFKESRTGVCYGLAWTESGGAMLPVETAKFAGNGDLIITGNLGDVMKESARIALSWLRSAGERYNFKPSDMRKFDFHLHVPEGAIPKDGPSAGITLAASLLSCLCKVPPKPAIAMTGELTLTGRLLPIGGLKEKLLAAIRNGMGTVILPEDNRDDWLELDKDVREGAAVVFAGTADDAFKTLFSGKIRRPVKRKGESAVTGRRV